MSTHHRARTQGRRFPVSWMKGLYHMCTDWARPTNTFTDPPGMPNDERMTDAEFRMVREFLGLPVSWLANYFGVRVRSVRHWESGDAPIPDAVRLAIEEIEMTTSQVVNEVISQLMDVGDVGRVTFRAVCPEDHAPGRHPCHCASDEQKSGKSVVKYCNLSAALT